MRVLKHNLAVAVVMATSVHVDVAVAASQCRNLPTAELERHIQEYVVRPSIARKYQADNLEIVTKEADYNPAAGIWMVPFYMLQQGKRTQRFFALVECDGRVELSRDQTFKP